MITKLTAAIVALATGSFFLLAKKQNITGTWVMNNKNKETAILRIQYGLGIYTAKLDLPSQEVFDKPVLIGMKDDSIWVRLDDKGNCYIKAVIDDSIMTGRSVVDGRGEDISFLRLKN